MHLTLLIVVHSSAMRFEHIPWVSYYLIRFPALVPNLYKLRTLAFERCRIRFKNGAITKDLFYYLVCLRSRAFPRKCVICSCCAIA